MQQKMFIYVDIIEILDESLLPGPARPDPHMTLSDEFFPIQLERYII